MINKDMIPILGLGIIALIVVNKLGKGVSTVYSDVKTGISDSVDTLKSGTILKTQAEKKTDPVVLAQKVATSKNWRAMEKALPTAQKTKMTVASAQAIANALHNQLRYPIITMTGANEIYKQFEKIGTLGGLYYVFNEFGIRDEQDLPTYISRKLGYSNVFSKDLDEVNELFRNKGINWRF